MQSTSSFSPFRFIRFSLPKHRAGGQFRFTSDGCPLAGVPLFPTRPARGWSDREAGRGPELTSRRRGIGGRTGTPDRPSPEPSRAPPPGRPAWPGSATAARSRRSGSRGASTLGRRPHGAQGPRSGHAPRRWPTDFPPARNGDRAMWVRRPAAYLPVLGDAQHGAAVGAEGVQEGPRTTVPREHRLLTHERGLADAEHLDGHRCSRTSRRRSPPRPPSCGRSAPCAPRRPGRCARGYAW